MKNKSILLGLVLTVITALGFAKGPKSEFQVEVLGAYIFSVSIEESTQGLEVYFLDDKGSILFEDEVYIGGGFGKTFDMKSLPNGKYQLKVIDEFRIQVLAVELKQGKVKMDLSNSRYYYIPEVTHSSEVSTVRMNSVSMLPMKMVIDNKTGRLLYSGKVEGYKYAFNLTEVEHNSKLVISSDGLITMEGLTL